MAYPVRGGGWNPEPEEVQERITLHALNATHAAIAAEFGISISASVQFKQRHLPEIEARAEEIFGVLQDRISKRWVSDAETLQEVREYLIETTLQRREEPDLPVRDYSRLNRDLDQLLYKASELAGLLTVRTQAQVEVKTPFKLGDVMAFGPNGELHEVRSDGSGSDG